MSGLVEGKLVLLVGKKTQNKTGNILKEDGKSVNLDGTIQC